jgi:hypothetical protein
LALIKNTKLKKYSDLVLRIRNLKRIIELYQKLGINKPNPSLKPIGIGTTVIKEDEKINED